MECNELLRLATLFQSVEPGAQLVANGQHSILRRSMFPSITETRYSSQTAILLTKSIFTEVLKYFLFTIIIY